MSLEAKIEALTNAVLKLDATVAALKQIGGYTPTAADSDKRIEIPSTPPTVVQPVQPTPAQNVPQVTHSAPPAAAMPPPPSFAPPQPAPVQAQGVVTAGAPFNDIKGLIGYAMETYKAIGPAKGAGIQTILQNLGYSNINSVAPEHFGQFYTAVEGLKA